MSTEKLATLASQRVDASLEVDVQPGTVVDGERTLGRHVGVGRVDLAIEAATVQAQERREVYVRLGHQALRQQRAVHAVLCSGSSGRKNVLIFIILV